MGSMLQFCEEAEPATARIFRVVYKFIWNAKGLTSSNLRFRAPAWVIFSTCFFLITLAVTGQSIYHSDSSENDDIY